MNHHSYIHNPNQSNHSSPNLSGFQGRARMNTSSPSWRSPPYRPRQSLHHQINYSGSNFVANSSPGNMYKFKNSYSPRNNSHSFRMSNSNYSSTPNRSFSSNNSLNGSESGFTPSPFSNRFHSRSFNKRGNWSKNRRSFNQSSHQERLKESIETYFKPSMLDNPWKKLESQEDISSNTKNSNNEAKLN